MFEIIIALTGFRLHLNIFSCLKIILKLPALNIAGLATGMAVALLIGLWVHNEYSYDEFLPNYQQLYQVKRNFNSNDEILTFNSTSLKLADALRNQIPEIEYVAEADFGQHGLGIRNFT